MANYMSEADEFLTLERLSEGYYMDRGSKFLAFASPVESEVEAGKFLQRIRKDHPKAKHYCTALRLFSDASLERTDDDGEPSGTAGRPILGQLIKNNLTNTMIVVVRYFGGTKLGVTGLTEAYKTSAANSIAEGKIIRRKIFAMISIGLSYEQLPILINHLKHSGIPVFREQYHDTPSIIIGAGKSTFADELKETFRRFSHMDFPHLDDYAKHLDLEIEILKEEKII